MSKPFPGSKKITTVWLQPDVVDKKMFFCPNCKIPVIEYDGHIASIIPGSHPYTPSTELKCKGSYRKRDGSYEECGMYFKFIASVIKEVDINRNE